MIKKLFFTLLSKWQKPFRKPAEPSDEIKLAEAIQKDILYLWKEIEGAEHLHHFVILRIELDNFRDWYQGSVDDFDVIMDGLEEYYSQRLNEFQRIETA